MHLCCQRVSLMASIVQDAIFQRLAEDRFFMVVPSIIITGKGYPDLATRYESMSPILIEVMS